MSRSLTALCTATNATASAARREAVAEAIGDTRLKTDLPDFDGRVGESRPASSLASREVDTPLPGAGMSIERAQLLAQQRRPEQALQELLPVLAEDPTDGTVVGHQSALEGVFRPRVGRPGLLEAVQALSESRVGLRPSIFSRKPLFGWASGDPFTTGMRRRLPIAT